MNKLESELSTRLHQTAERATVRPDLQGVLNGTRAEGRSVPNPGGRRALGPRLVFVGVAAVALGAGWYALGGGAVNEVPVEVASPVPSTTPAPVAGNSRPSVYLEGPGIEPSALSVAAAPEAARGGDWELKSAYALIIEGNRPLMATVAAVPSATTSVDAMLTGLAPGADRSELNVAGVSATAVRIMTAEGAERIVAFDDGHQVVTLFFGPDVDDDAYERLLAAVRLDRDGFDRLVARSDSAAESQVEEPEGAGDQYPGLLTSARLAEGSYVYTYEGEEDFGATGDVVDQSTPQAACGSYADLLQLAGELSGHKRSFSGADGWRVTHYYQPAAADQAQRALELVGQIGLECGFDDYSSDYDSTDDVEAAGVVTAFGASDGRFFLAAYTRDSTLYVIELEGGGGDDGVLRLRQLIDLATR